MKLVSPDFLATPVTVTWLVLGCGRASQPLLIRLSFPNTSVIQDDYDTWVGEAALVQWGAGKHADEGWIRYNRHDQRANYIYTDGHVERLRWGKARFDQFPDHQVRKPLPHSPP